MISACDRLIFIRNTIFVCVGYFYTPLKNRKNLKMEKSFFSNFAFYNFQNFFRITFYKNYFIGKVLEIILKSKNEKVI